MAERGLLLIIQRGQRGRILSLVRSRPRGVVAVVEIIQLVRVGRAVLVVVRDMEVGVHIEGWARPCKAMMVVIVRRTIIPLLAVVVQPPWVAIQPWMSEEVVELERPIPFLDLP